MKQTHKIITVLCLLIALGALLLSGCAPSDLQDGYIMEGVTVAGVKIGGLTKEDALAAVRAATADTYTKTPMTVEILDETIILSPELTGIRLDAEVDLVVSADIVKAGMGYNTENATFLLLTADNPVNTREIVRNILQDVFHPLAVFLCKFLVSKAKTAPAHICKSVTIALHDVFFHTHLCARAELLQFQTPEGVT